jgi:potassium/hydrogen antiporter
MSEIADFALPVLLVAGGVVLATLSTKLSDRVPVPAPVVFLVVAAIASDAWPGLDDALPIRTVERIAVVALVIILINGGMDIGWRRMRSSLAPVLALGVVGTFLTAGVVALAAHVVLGFDWVLAGIVGAALAPTDPAVVFSVLGGREIEGRAGTVLEGEAGVNDPAGIALMIGMIELATHPDASFLVVVKDFALEMGIGVAVGVVAGRLLVGFLHRVRLGNAALYPVLVLSLGAALYAATSLAGGSGFLAVFVAGLFLGDAPTPFKAEITRFHGSLANLAEIVVFAALGLTVHLGGLTAEIWLHGAILVLVLAVVARPASVLATLAWARLTSAERAFLAWSGLKGAVPILLAAFAVIGGVEGARPIYGLVFVVVLVSVLGQGTLVPFVARRLALGIREPQVLPWHLTVALAHPPEEAFDFLVAPNSRAVGLPVTELPGQGGATWLRFLVRDGRALRPRPGLRLQAGDHVHAFADDDGAAELADLFA